MPTDFDWKSWMKKKEEPPPAPPPPEPEPKMIVFITKFADLMMYIVLAIILVCAWVYIEDSSTTFRIIDKCNNQQGVAIRTLRGDSVCIRQDVLTDVLNAKSTNRAN